MTQPPQPCPACLGDRVTEHTRAEIDLDDQGRQIPVQRTYTAPCGTCHGSGTAD